MDQEARTGEAALSTAPSDRRFFFLGNSLCVDFVNTQAVEAGQLIDRLRHFDALVVWFEQAQVLDALHARRLSTEWGGSAEAASTLAQALDFRAHLRQMLERLSAGKSVPQATIMA